MAEHDAHGIRAVVSLYALLGYRKFRQSKTVYLTVKKKPNVKNSTANMKASSGLYITGSDEQRGSSGRPFFMRSETIILQEIFPDNSAEGSSDMQ